MKTYLEEARILAGLDNPHIVPVYEIGTTEDGLTFVVSKFIEGTDLAEQIKQERPSFTCAAEIIATVAKALHYAHLKRLVHRDVKPGNILLDSTGIPYVADLGLALREEDFGKGERYAGTPAYMSPEQACGTGHLVDGRSDVFSLGVVLYELLTGRRPFRGETRQELMEQIIGVDARPPRQINDAIPKDLERICLKALAKRPTERYTTAKDMADDLRSFLGQVTTVQENALPKPVTKVRASKRIRRLVLIGAVVTLFAGLTALVARLGFTRNGGDARTADKPDLVDIFSVEWVGRGAGAIVDDQAAPRLKGMKPLLVEDKEELWGYQLAHIIDPDVQDVCDFTGATACAVSFELQPRPGVPWLRVDGIDIIVHEYRESPQYFGVFPFPIEYANVYYVEMDKPDDVKGRTFTASGYFFSESEPGQRLHRKGKGQRRDLEFVRLTEGKPEAFVVRINANTPGVYTFSGVVRLSYRDEQSEQAIFSSETFLFDGQRKKQQDKKK
jgi:hypothetical protein